MGIAAGSEVFAPLLPVGFHEADLAGLRRLCVDYFPRSTTRPKLMEIIATIVASVNQVSIPARLWIDGSFLTERENPEVFDLTLVVVESVYRSMSPDQHTYFDWFRRTSFFENYKCDNYALVLDAERPDWDAIYRYWLRQYGFLGKPGKKGVIELVVPTLRS